MYILVLYFVFLAILFPKLAVFLYLIFRFSISKINDKKILKLIDFSLSIYLSICVSKMLADRPYYIGAEAGFGFDMYHYYNAFEWVGSTNILDFIKNFSTVTEMTGSAEPFFWIFVKIISLIFSNEYFIHFILTFLGCLFIYMAGQVWNKCGILFLFFYTNTITFFAFQGSAIRSGLAFSMAMLGYALLLKNKLKIVNYFSPFIHFSMIPMPLISYASTVNFNDTKKMIRLFFISFILIILFIIWALKSSDAGLGSKVTARLSEDELDLTSIIQFFLESCFTFYLAFIVFKNNVSKQLKISFLLFFLVACFLLLLSPTAFSRFYRYEYIFIIYIYASIFLSSNKYIKLMILILSISWLIFLGFNRYVGVFGNNIFDFIGFNLVYRFY